MPLATSHFFCHIWTTKIFEYGKWLVGYTINQSINIYWACNMGLAAGATAGCCFIVLLRERPDCSTSSIIEFLNAILSLQIGHLAFFLKPLKCSWTLLINKNLDSSIRKTQIKTSSPTTFCVTLSKYLISVNLSFLICKMEIINISFKRQLCWLNQIMPDSDYTQ